MPPWEVLGLTREEARDPATVKRAYARMLKLHRPDRDPEGFRRVRDAYELMTNHPAMVAAWLADDGETDDEDDAADDESDDDDQPTDVSPPSAAPAAQPQEVAPAVPVSLPEPALGAADDSAPSPADVAGSPAPLSLERVPAAVDPLTLAIAELAAVCAAPDADDQRCEAAARRVLVLGGDAGESWRRAVAAVAHHLAERPAVLAVLMPHDVALRALEDDLGEPVDVLLTWWRDQRRWRQVACFAEVVAERLRAGHTEHALLAARLAMDLAAREPRIARVLVDLAFRELPAHQRRILDSVDHRLALGAEMTAWPETLRHRLVDALDDGRVPEDPLFRQQVTAQLGKLPATSPLRRAVKDGIPGLRLRASRIARSPEPAGGRSGCGGLVWWWVIALVLMNALRLCGSGSSTSHSSSHQPPRFQPPVRVEPIPLPPPPTPTSQPLSDAMTRESRILQAMVHMHATGGDRQLVASYVRGERMPFRADQPDYPYLLAAIVSDEQLQQADRIAAVQRLGQQPGQTGHLLLGRLRAQRLPPAIDLAVDQAWSDQVVRTMNGPLRSPAGRPLEVPTPATELVGQPPVRVEAPSSPAPPAETAAEPASPVEAENASPPVRAGQDP